MGDDFRRMREIAPGVYEIPKEKKMRVPGLIVATRGLLEETLMSKAIDQVKNVAHLRGIIGYSIAMPDIHWGYGFPIGGVAAMDLEEGVVSPGGVGYDINCGVRLAILDEPLDRLSEKVKSDLLKNIYEKVPSGLHKEQKLYHPLEKHDYESIAKNGIDWSIHRGFTKEKDKEHIENFGCLSGGSVDFISNEAFQRGSKQLGTLGSGNHFIEIGSVDHLFDETVASKWKVKKGDTYILIHSGSRGFGHQVCQDFLDRLIKTPLTSELPDKQLACALIGSADGKAYLSSMATAANFAFNNRQLILHLVRLAFKETLNIPTDRIRLLYDVCHNIAKVETHLIEGSYKKVLVHRKGATRAYGKNHEDLCYDYQLTGQPVLVPGDMERASFLLQGLGNPLTFASACHGAGRHLSRTESMNLFFSQDLVKAMRSRNISVMASSKRSIAEEMPEAYKDVEEVVRAVELAKLAHIVARLKPSLVIKG